MGRKAHEGFRWEFLQGGMGGDKRCPVKRTDFHRQILGTSSRVRRVILSG